MREGLGSKQALPYGRASASQPQAEAYRTLD